MSYLPLDGRGWRLAMGLRPLKEGDWLEVDERRDDELALKAELLDRHYARVVGLRPAAEAASNELLEMIGDFLAAHYPERATSVNRSEPALVAAARLVQEDLCVMVREDEWRLLAAVVCFPSRWQLAEKIGASLDEIHDPVPGYEDALGSSTRAVFDRLTPARAFWRLNWTLLDSPELFQPVGARHAGATPISEWHFRVERQTIRRLPRSGAVVFTIRTYVTPLSQILARPGAGADLLHAIETAPPATRAYKGWNGVAERLADLVRA